MFLALKPFIPLSFLAAASNIFLGWSVPAIICLVVGIVLIIVEMFMPGFGFAGGFGILAIVAAIILRANTFLEALIIAAVILLFLILVGVIIYHSFTKGMISRSSIMLHDKIDSESTSLRKEANNRIGKVGKTISYLRPAGIADFDGERLDVVSEGEFIEAGAEVVITSVEGVRIIVRRYVPDVEKKQEAEQAEAQSEIETDNQGE